jgi:hypothetical protein
MKATTQSAVRYPLVVESPEVVGEVVGVVVNLFQQVLHQLAAGRKDRGRGGGGGEEVISMAYLKQNSIIAIDTMDGMRLILACQQHNMYSSYLVLYPCADADPPRLAERNQV